VTSALAFRRKCACVCVFGCVGVCVRVCVCVLLLSTYEFANAHSEHSQDRKLITPGADGTAPDLSPEKLKVILDQLDTVLAKF
jgi:hypothetical protein